MTERRMLSLSVSGLKKAQTKFVKFNRNFRYRYAELKQRITDQLLLEIDQNFATESYANTATTRKEWQELTLGTLLSSKRRLGGILHKTGNLRAGFHVIKTGNRENITIRNYVKYGKYHQYGDGVVARPMLPVAARVRKLVADEAKKYIDERLREVNL